MRTTVRFKTLIAVAAATALLVAPATVWAIDRFTDVPDTNVFHNDIKWLADNGVTLGCNPPTNDRFCPTDAVTREQMAAFMRRLAENQVVDAETALIAAEALEAANADNLDGLDSEDFVTTRGDAELRGAAYVNGSTVAIEDSTGIVDSVTQSVTGEYIVHLTENVGFPFINVTSVNILGVHCNWAFNGSDAIPRFEVLCKKTSDGSAADASFTVTIWDNPTGIAGSGSADPSAGLDG